MTALSIPGELGGENDPTSTASAGVQQDQNTLFVEMGNESVMEERSSEEVAAAEEIVREIKTEEPNVFAMQEQEEERVDKAISDER